MPILKNVVGLDLGSHSIKAVELQQNLRGFQVLQVRSLPREPDFPLAELVHRLFTLYRFSTDHVVSALPGDRISSRRLTFPFRERRKLAQAVPFEVADEVPFELEDIVIDWELLDGERSKANVIANVAPRAEVSAFLETLREAECEPRTLEAEGLVLGNLAGLFALDGNRLLIDLGHRKTTLCLLVEGRALGARTVPVGGEALTAAIAEDRGLGLEAAEQLKCERGVFDRHLAVLGPRTEAVLDRIGREIVRSLGSAETVLGAREISQTSLFGGTAQLDRLDDYLAERTGIPTARIGYPPEGADAGLVAAGEPVLFAPAIALAVRGTAQARTRMNFRQDEFAVRVDLGRFGREFRSTAVLAAVSLGLALLSFGIGTWLDSRRAAALEREVARLYAEAFPGRPVPTSPLSALRSEVETANERADFLGVYRGNLSALDVLTEISSHVPKDLDVVLEELSIDRQTIRMRVYGKSFEAADRLRAELAKFPPFHQVRVGAIETDRKRGGKRFNVTIGLAEPKERA